MPPLGPTTPSVQRRQAIIHTDGFGLFPVRSPLLRELFLFFGVLRCFSSPTCLSTVYTIEYLSIERGLPHSEISGSVRKRLPGAYRSVSTSFIGPGCLGIHHMPFLACLKLPISLTLAALLPSSAHTLLVDTCLRVEKDKPTLGARTEAS